MSQTMPASTRHCWFRCARCIFACGHLPYRRFGVGMPPDTSPDHHDTNSEHGDDANLTKDKVMIEQACMLIRSVPIKGRLCHAGTSSSRVFRLLAFSLLCLKRLVGQGTFSVQVVGRPNPCCNCGRTRSPVMTPSEMTRPPGNGIPLKWRCAPALELPPPRGTRPFRCKASCGPRAAPC